MDSRSAPAAVAESLRALWGEPWTVEGIVARRAKSRIFRARSASRAAAIKECLILESSLPDPVAAEREFTALTTLLERTSKSDVPPLAPTPLVLCREHAAYAMTWVSGRSATEAVLSPSTDLDRATRLGESAGDWLRRFHAFRPLPVQGNDFEAKVDYVNQIAEKVGNREPLLRRAAGVLVDRATDAAAQFMPASWLHGDMKSDNLLIDGDELTGLDVQMDIENTVAYDVAPFLNHLRLLRWSPRGLLQRRKLDRMAQAFLQAYSPDSKDWKLPLLWLRTYLLIQIAAPSAQTPALRTRMSRWPARIELGIVLDQMEKCQ